MDYPKIAMPPQEYHKGDMSMELLTGKENTAELAIPFNTLSKTQGGTEDRLLPNLLWWTCPFF